MSPSSKQPDKATTATEKHASSCPDSLPQNQAKKSSLGALDPNDGQTEKSSQWKLDPLEQHHLNRFYNELDIGIALVNGNLDLFFMNTWLKRKISPRHRSAWEAGTLTNLNQLSEAIDLDRLATMAQKTLRYNYIQMISQAFHKWAIPLPDNRFPDGNMRQTCILKPYDTFFHKRSWPDAIPVPPKHENGEGYFHGKQSWPDVILAPPDHENNEGYFHGKKEDVSHRYDGKTSSSSRLVLIQIKDESDTVLRTENLKASKKTIQEKNVALKQANEQLDKQNRALQQLNDQLKQREAYVKIKTKMEALGCMAGGIAHDFNNFLTVILGSVELAMDDVDTDHPVFDLLEEIEKSSHAASHVVKQILHYCHPNYIQAEKMPLNLDQTIQDQLPLLRSMLPEETHLQYQKEDAMDSTTVVAALSQIQEILINLVRNAVEAVQQRHGNHKIDNMEGQNSLREAYPMEGGEFHPRHPDGWHRDRGKIRIHLTPYRHNMPSEVEQNHYVSPDGDFWKALNEADEKKYLKLIVTDNGQGIRSSHLDRIFDPYYTTKDVGEGSGFGLSTVHGLIKHLNGGIRAQSRWGEGSSLEIVLPIY